MKRTSGKGAGRHKGKGRSASKSKSSYSKSPGTKRNRGGVKSYGTDRNDTDRPRFSREGASSEKGHFKSIRSKSTSGDSPSRAEGDRPKRYNREEGSSERGNFNRGSDAPTVKKNFYPPRAGDKSERGSFKRSDKPVCISSKMSRML